MRIVTVVFGLCLVVVGGAAYAVLGSTSKRPPESRVAVQVVPDVPRAESARLFSVVPAPREPDAIAMKLTTHPVPPPQMTPGRWPDTARPQQAVSPAVPKVKSAVKAEKPKTKAKTKQASKTATPKAI